MLRCGVPKSFKKLCECWPAWEPTEILCSTGVMLKVLEQTDLSRSFYEILCPLSLALEDS